MQNIIRKNKGKDYAFGTDHMFIKVSSESTAGKLCLAEDHIKPGWKLPRHHHKKMFEVFYVLEGEMQFDFDEESMVAKAGDTVSIPPMVWHAASCENGAKMLTIFSHGRFDDYLEKLSTMKEEEFKNESLMQRISEEFDIYEK